MGWIWKRVPLLVQALGLAAQQVHELLDFYHAVQHLGLVAALRKDWSAKARTRWRTHQRRLLLQGQVEQVIAAVQGLCRGRNSKAMRTQLDYFIKNQSRMAYATLMAMKLPIGSGAIEVSRLQYPYPDSRLLSYYWPDGIIKPCRRCRQATLEDRRRERKCMPIPVLPPASRSPRDHGAVGATASGQSPTSHAAAQSASGAPAAQRRHLRGGGQS